MTAPLYLGLSGTSALLHVVTNQLLNAIDNDEIVHVEIHMDTLLRHDIPWEALLFFSRYALEAEHPRCHKYLRQIIETTYNL